MLSAQSPSIALTIPSHGIVIWDAILSAHMFQFEANESRLRTEAALMGIDDLESLWLVLSRISASEKVRIFQERNPHLDLTNPWALDGYELAIGVLRMAAEE